MKSNLERALALFLLAALATAVPACGDKAPAKRSEAKGEDVGHDEHGESKEHGEAEDHPEGKEHGGGDEHDQAEEEGVLRLSPEQLADAGIRIAPSGPAAIDSGTELLGEVHPNGDRLAHIVPRFPGIVREVRKNAGDRVTVGEVLAILESSDSLAPYPLKTSIEGVVLSKHLTLGEAVDRETEAFVVADLRTVWVDLAVYQKDLGRISIGQPVRIHAVGEGADTEGTISYVTPAVDQTTRTATARVVIANASRKFLPGMFVTAHTLDAIEAAVVVPRDALQTVEGRSAVFVETADGLTPRPVVLGRQGNTRVEIASGLASGERVAVTNTFLLKAELAKSEAEHDH